MDIITLITLQFTIQFAGIIEGYLFFSVILYLFQLFFKRYATLFQRIQTTHQYFIAFWSSIAILGFVILLGVILIKPSYISLFDWTLLRMRLLVVLFASLAVLYWWITIRTNKFFALLLFFTGIVQILLIWLTTPFLNTWALPLPNTYGSIWINFHVPFSEPLLGLMYSFWVLVFFGIREARLYLRLKN